MIYVDTKIVTFKEESNLKLLWVNIRMAELYEKYSSIQTCYPYHFFDVKRSNLRCSFPCYSTPLTKQLNVHSYLSREKMAQFPSPSFI